MRAPLFRVPALSRIINGYCCAVVYRTVVSHIICHMMYYIIQTNILSREDPYAKRGYGGCNPPKFIISKIFWVNIWQLYYSDRTVLKFCVNRMAVCTLIKTVVLKVLLLIRSGRFIFFPIFSLVLLVMLMVLINATVIHLT